MITDSQQREDIQVTHWCESFKETCRARGIRITDQRLAVYRALAGDTSHPTAETLFLRVRENMPSMSLATLYRTLEFLEKERLIRRVSAPEAIGRYDANLEPHQHLVCRKCGMLSDLHIETFSQLLPDTGDFTVEEMDVRYVGLCGRCAKRQEV